MRDQTAPAAARRLISRDAAALMAGAAAVLLGAGAQALDGRVFFGFDRAALTPQAAETIRDLVGRFQAGGYSRLVVVGHADAAGPALYNEALSLRRAQTVAAEIRRYGVDPVVLAVQARGEREPAVLTADGAPEPRNRRAEIVYLR